MGMAPTKSFEEMAKEAEMAPAPTESTTPTTQPAEKTDECCGACNGEKKKE